MEIYTNSIAKTNTVTCENPFEIVLENMTSPYSEKEDMHEIVSTVAYLIGIPKRIFENVHESPKLSRFNQLDYDKNARIIRNLCMIRTAIERNFKAINDQMTHEHRSLYYLSELPAEAMTQLNRDGINFIKKNNTRLAYHIVEINRLVSDRINNCRSLFPDWTKWEYIRDLFIMPNGLTEAGTKEAADLYYANKQYYPYQVYINWQPYDAGNILFNDHKFMTVLYEQHNDYFLEHNKTRDAGEAIKNAIYDFIDESRKAIIFVDCENSDPYKLYAALRNLNPDELVKISRIILFDDRHTTAAWQALEQYTDIPVEHILIDRLLENKSLVDGMLTARACEEHYRNGVDSMILCSSDSDYYALISSLRSARFLLMIEPDKCSPKMKETLRDHSIYCCSLDDFYTGDGETLKFRTMLGEFSRMLEPLCFNINDMLDRALRSSRATMSTVERSQFMEKYLRRLSLVIDPCGNVAFDLNIK